MNFPASLDTTSTLPNPSGTDKQNNPDHGALHTAENQAIIALEAKVGTGASTPVVNTILFGTGTGTSAFQQLTSAQLAAVLSDETGSGANVFSNTPVLITPKVDTIQENTVGNGVTVAGLSVKSGVLQTSSSVPTAALQNSSVDSTKVATGIPVQIVSTNFGAVGTGTTTIPFDDTIPQITEGTEFMTQAITPKAATNRLSIEATLYASNSVLGELIGALFQDATANALAALSLTIPTGGYLGRITLRHDMAAGTTSSTTFRIRLGGSGAGTITFNGTAGTRKFGGITMSNIKITEYKV
jgi:hypothetical protein